MQLSHMHLGRIDMLEEIAAQLDVRFRYFFPCHIATYQQNAKTCTQVTPSEAFAMLDDPQGSAYYGTGPGFCESERCFVAGAPKILDDT
jgi:hypothetical protein